MGVLNSFCPEGGEFAHQKNCPGVLPGGGWSGLELTDTLTLRVWTLQAAQSMKKGSMVVKPVINQCIGEELSRNYRNT